MDCIHEQILTIERRINARAPEYNPVAVHLQRKTGKNARIGKVHLKWAFSEVDCLFLPLRGNERARLYHQKVVNRDGKAKALSIIESVARANSLHPLEKEGPK